MEKQPISFAIGIPTINQWPVSLQQYLRFYRTDFPGIKIYIIDNGWQSIVIYDHDVIVSSYPKNIGVAASWNQLCRSIYQDGHTHAMIVNDDVYPGRSKDHIQLILEKYPRDLYKSSRDDMSLFILPQTTFDRIGPFNTAFYPAYFEDRDYLWRMKLAGCSIMSSIKFDPMIYKESQSTKKDPSLLDRFDANELLYIEMWGGKPGFEKFTKPFNGSESAGQ